MAKVEKRPCVSCGRLVPEFEEYPYPGCSDDCKLANEWRASRRSEEALRKAAEAALRVMPTKHARACRVNGDPEFGLCNCGYEQSKALRAALVK